MAKPRDKIALWRPTFKPSSIMNKITGHNYSQWLNSPIITRKIPAPGIHLSNSTAVTTFVPPTKKTLILALSQNQQTN